MIWIAALVGVLVVGGAVIAAIGSSLPKSHQVTRAVEVKEKPEVVWSILTDHAAQPSWRKDLKAAERLPDREGRQVWKESFQRGTPVTLETVEVVPNLKLVRTMADVGGPFSGTWTFELEPTATGTRVRLTEQGQVNSPVFRFVTRYMVGYSTFVEGYLKELAAKVGSPEAQVLDLTPATAG